ncbi:MAG: ABC transporter permease [Chloroflexaceae bacterium]|jgi:peptide/nickel transport system permease protein|nr:ABC transporter permease [Chloroflexaceae bacterium]
MATAASPTVSVEEGKREQSETQWAIAFRRFRRHRLAMISLFVLVIFYMVAFLAPVIAPFPRDYQRVQDGLLTPMSVDTQGNVRILGSDRIGKDLFSLLLYAARISLTTALIVSLIAATVGVVLGLVAGFFRGWVDTIITRTAEFISTFPDLPILLILASILVRSENVPVPGFITAFVGVVMGISERESRIVALVILVLSFLSWIGIFRLMRGMVFQVREQQYIESSRALGASNLRILAKHVFPNALPPIIVSFTLLLNGALVSESALSFLGLGIQEPTPTWGNMLNVARSFMFEHPWMPLVPSLPLLIVAIAINYIGDGLRDALDPRQRAG